MALLVCTLGTEAVLVHQQHMPVDLISATVTNTTWSLVNFVTHPPINVSIFAAAAERVLEYELPKAGSPKVDKTVLVLLAMLLPGFGADRCFNGQICCGVLKFITGGGFGIWWLVDWIVIVSNALSKSKDINSIGFKAEFKEETVDTAYSVALIVLLIQLIPLIAQIVLVCVSAGSMGVAAAGAAVAIRRQQSDVYTKQRDTVVTSLPVTLQGTFRRFLLLNACPSQGELVAMFQEIDKNGDGQLEKGEIKTYLGNRGVTDEDIESMIKGADQDGDGKISSSEWIKALSAKNEQV